LDLYERLNLITRNTLEVVTPEELKELLEVNSSPRAYWGFECSG
jgi:tyrosyl-tRNA synthetase